MQIGIIGKGKMGRDIFNHLFQFDDTLVLICRKSEDVEALTAATEKQLKKMLSRGYLTEAEFERKKQAYRISTELSTLKDCDLVIESVVEDRKIKQDIFNRLETVVKPDCILATNTSSIPLSIVFEKCNKKERCMGLHFFFPVKVIRTVEVNRTRYTEQAYVESVKALLARVDKNGLELKEEANMVLTRMFTTLITQVYKIYEESDLKIEEIDRILKMHFVTFGLFEIIDATGIDIILESIENFTSDRYKKLYMPLYWKGQELLAAGYRGGAGNKGLAAYEQAHPAMHKELEAADLAAYGQTIVLRLQSLLINELAYFINNGFAEREQISEAVQEVFGLSENPVAMLKRIGSQAISECLLDSRQKWQDALYQPLDLSIFNR